MLSRRAAPRAIRVSAMGRVIRLGCGSVSAVSRAGVFGAAPQHVASRRASCVVGAAPPLLRRLFSCCVVLRGAVGPNADVVKRWCDGGSIPVVVRVVVWW